MTLILFILSFIICIALGVSIGASESSDLKLAGAIMGSAAVSIGVLATFLIMRKIFRVVGMPTIWGYILGTLTMIIGAGAFVFMAFATGLLTLGSAPEMNSRFISYAIFALLWLGMMIRGGMKATTILAFVLGGILGALLYPLSITLIPGLFGTWFKDPEYIATNLQATRIVFAVLGAFAGALGASSAWASGFGLKNSDS